MRNNAFLAAGLLTLALAACGSSEPDPVVEQIIIREPGEPAANAVIEEAAAAAGDVDLVALGEDAFQQCTGCHNADPGGPNMAGPNLHGIVGKAAAANSDYPYSEALANAGLTWDAATLDRFLANPAAYVEGTSMVAGAVRSGEDRAAIVAYLAATNEGS
ncbi:MAG: c-type cytochrome [Pseudomonadota bacterium]